ncbi:MAG: hypothetical protein HC884_19280 [Chloroflexaceae bacterium]|nr:hypothetical protein [Chloroflexaceae bacterium]
MEKSAEKTAIIQDRARALLTSGTVDVFIGYKTGSTMLRVTPCVITDANEVEALAWNAMCINNLVATLKKYAHQRAAIVVKGCDARSLVELIKLNQVQREQVYIVGLPCSGILDPKKVARKRPLTSIKAISVQEDRIILFEGSGILACTREELLYDKCLTCTHPNPLIADELVGDAIDEAVTHTGDKFADVEELEQLAVEERRAFWQAELSKCTLCYACQTICPMCFCKGCTVTLPKNDPQRKARTPASVFSFHINRAYHMVGRCTGCLECERVCPVGIPLSAIFKKVEKDTQELFDYEAGVSVDDVPPLSNWKDA